jgi:hypothetical protein
VSAIATAIGIVLAKKYVIAMPASGSAMVRRSAFGAPPSRQYTCPAAWTVRMRIAMLNSVR